MFGIDRPNVGFWQGRGLRNVRDEHSNPWVLGKVEDLALRWTGQAGYGWQVGGTSWCRLRLPSICTRFLSLQDVGVQCTQVLVQRLARIEYQARIAPRLVPSADLDHLLPA